MQKLEELINIILIPKILNKNLNLKEGLLL